MIAAPPSLPAEEVDGSTDSTFDLDQHDWRVFTINASRHYDISVELVEGGPVDVIMTESWQPGPISHVSYSEKFSRFGVKSVSIGYEGELALAGDLHVVVDNSNWKPGTNTTGPVKVHVEVTSGGKEEKVSIIDLFDSGMCIVVVTLVVIMGVALAGLAVARRRNQNMIPLSSGGAMGPRGEGSGGPDTSTEPDEEPAGGRDDACPSCGALWKMDVETRKWCCPYCKHPAPEDFEGHRRGSSP